MNSMVSAVMTWPGHHDGEARGIGDHELGGDGLAALHQIIDLLAVELHVRAVLRVVGQEERRAHVAFVGLALRILAEGIVEPAEVRQIGHVGDQALDAGVERRLLVVILRQLAVQFARDVGQHLDEVGDVAAGVVDVGLEQDAVARGLVELDVETCSRAFP